MKNRSHDGLAANNLVPRATILLTCGRDRELWPDPIFWACAECSFHILSQSNLPDLTKSVSRGLPVLDKARALNPCRRSEWSWALGTRMSCTGPIEGGRHEWGTNETKKSISSNRSQQNFYSDILTYHLHPLHWSYPEVLLLLGFDQEISSLFPVPWWWLYHLHPCQTVRMLLWILQTRDRRQTLNVKRMHSNIYVYYTALVLLIQHYPSDTLSHWSWSRSYTWVPKTLQKLLSNWKGPTKIALQKTLWKIW